MLQPCIFWHDLINTTTKENPRWQPAKTYSQNGTSVCSWLKKKVKIRSPFISSTELFNQFCVEARRLPLCLSALLKKCSSVLPSSLCCLYLAPKHYLLLPCSLHYVISVVLCFADYQLYYRRCSLVLRYSILKCCSLLLVSLLKCTSQWNFRLFH